jgi:uncharacterized surface protein with fasciclin (FAS1) repeats
MKKFGLNIAGVAGCLALAAILGWSALPTNAAGDSCPLAKAAGAGAKAGTCNASKAAAGTCPSSAKNASLAKNEEKGGCCADKAAKQVAAKEGGCAEGACKGKDIAHLVMSDSRFTTLALAVKAAGMSGEFECPLPKTVLAPTNEAFQKIPAEQWAAILQDDAKLKALVANHIIKGGAMQSCALKDAKTAKSAGGSDLAVSACPQSGQVSINNANLVGDALVASNGVVHAIDSVLLPADMQVAKAEVEAPVQVAAAK